MYDSTPPMQSIALAPYPQSAFFTQVDTEALDKVKTLRWLIAKEQVNEPALVQMAILQDLIVSIRNLRAELKIESKIKVPIQVFFPCAIH